MSTSETRAGVLYRSVFLSSAGEPGVQARLREGKRRAEAERDTLFNGLAAGTIPVLEACASPTKATRNIPVGKVLAAAGLSKTAVNRVLKRYRFLLEHYSMPDRTVTVPAQRVITLGWVADTPSGVRLMLLKEALKPSGTVEPWTGFPWTPTPVGPDPFDEDVEW